MSIKECCACSGPIELPDAHDACICVLCLGCAHAEAVLDTPDCSFCEKMMVRTLRGRSSAIVNCARAASSPPPSVAIEPQKEKPRQPRAVVVVR